MSSELTHEQILQIIAKSGLASMSASGNCFTFAVALRRALLPNGVLAVAVNKAILDACNRYIGHAAVRFDGAFYHGNGWMDWEEFLEWGMFDPQDKVYAELACIPFKTWSRVASRAEIYEVDEEDLMGPYVKQDLLPTFEKAINEARRQLGL